LFLLSNREQAVLAALEKACLVISSLQQQFLFVEHCKHKPAAYCKGGDKSFCLSVTMQKKSSPNLVDLLV
jgi:hypothetical protein